MKADWDKVKEVFDLALDQPVDLRPEFVKKSCGTDQELLAEVESLLKVYDEPENLIEKNALIFNSTNDNQLNKENVENNSQTSFSIPFATSQLKGDLDNIILMSLRKEPERRYASAVELSDDIAKYLNGLPVSARPNTYKYRAEKYFKRHKIGVLAAILILLSLINGTIISIWQAQKARREAAKAEAVSLFMQKMLQTGNTERISSGKKGYSATVGDILTDAVQRIENGELDAQPDVKAEVLQVISEAFLTQNDYESTEKILRDLIVLKTNLYGEKSPQLLEAKTSFASFLTQKGNINEAGEIYEQILPMLKEAYNKGNIEPGYLTSAVSDYALVCRARGDSGKAESLYRQNLEIADKSKMPAQYKIGYMALLSLTLMDQGKFDEAESFLRQSIEILKRESAIETIEMSNMQTALGSVLMEKDNLSEAETNLQEAEAIYRKLQNPNSIPIYDNLRLQAQVLYKAGKYKEAETKINQVLDIYDKFASPAYLNYATALMIKGLTLNKLGKSNEAESLLRKAVQLRIENLPANHFMTALTKSALGECLVTQKKFAEAEPLLHESYESLKNSQGEINLRTKLAKQRLFQLYKSWGREEQAQTFQ